MRIDRQARVNPLRRVRTPLVENPESKDRLSVPGQGSRVKRRKRPMALIINILRGGSAGARPTGPPGEIRSH